MIKKLRILFALLSSASGAIFLLAEWSAVGSAVVAASLALCIFNGLLALMPESKEREMTINWTPTVRPTIPAPKSERENS